MKVAFSLIGGISWTGGLNYLKNLISVLADHKHLNIEPVLFVSSNSDNRAVESLRPYLHQSPISIFESGFGPLNQIYQNFNAHILQRDYNLERKYRRAEIDVVFQHGCWFGARFPIPTVAWITDMQHRHLPEMFGFRNYYRREIMFQLMARYANRIMVSSEDAKRDCEYYYANSIGKVRAVPFAVEIPPSALNLDPKIIRDSYDIPEKFIYLPNQLWRHKNHFVIVKALARLKERFNQITVVSSGKAMDHRHPNHPRMILELVRNSGLVNRFRFIGLIPYDHVIALMRASCAVLNPSLFEGWSTTVEEAKSLGIRLILSDIPIHREQSTGNVSYFNPNDQLSAANALEAEWIGGIPGPHLQRERLALDGVGVRRSNFANLFHNIVSEAMIS